LARGYFDARPVVEVDGATHSTAEEIVRDATRSAAPSEQGFAILRFTNEDVFRNLDGGLETVRARLKELRPDRRRSELTHGKFGATPDPPAPTRGAGEARRISNR
jgi:hypothetical protein